MYKFRGEKEENSEPYKKAFKFRSGDFKIKNQILVNGFLLTEKKYFQKANYYAYTFKNCNQQSLTK